MQTVLLVGIQEGGKRHLSVRSWSAAWQVYLISALLHVPRSVSKQGCWWHGCFGEGRQGPRAMVGEPSGRILKKICKRPGTNPDKISKRPGMCSQVRSPDKCWSWYSTGLAPLVQILSPGQHRTQGVQKELVSWKLPIMLPSHTISDRITESKKCRF